MVMVVEDGTGLAGSNSYVSLEAASAYLSSIGYGDVWGSTDRTDDQRSAALVRASMYIDATYRSMFPGYPTNGRAQALEWPRVGAYTYVSDRGRSDAVLYSPGYGNVSFTNGVYSIASNEVPREVVAAVCQGALRELATPGALAPDLDRGGMIKTASAGSVSVTYADGAPSVTVFQQVELCLASLLLPSNSYCGSVGRG